MEHKLRELCILFFSCQNYSSQKEDANNEPEEHMGYAKDCPQWDCAVSLPGRHPMS